MQERRRHLAAAQPGVAQNEIGWNLSTAAFALLVIVPQLTKTDVMLWTAAEENEADEDATLSRVLHLPPIML
jgi:hypothetical protein